MNAIVTDPFPTQRRPWVHRCHGCGTKMVDNLHDPGVHCPLCDPKSYDAQLRLTDA
jgi:rRNA maturation endonuclease Nob1